MTNMIYSIFCIHSIYDMYDVFDIYIELEPHVEVNGAAVAQQEYHRRLEQINILSKAGS